MRKEIDSIPSPRRGRVRERVENLTIRFEVAPLSSPLPQGKKDVVKY
jgi:hypothetical protein